MPKQWFPLESNPGVMTTYVSNLGVDMSTFQFHDVLSTEDWALDMIPSPVLGVVMLFPVKPVSEQARKEEHDRISSSPQPQVISPNLFYTKQTVGNACGTIGLLHCVLNARDKLTIDADSFLSKFYAKCSSLSPEEIAKFLEEDDEIEVTHECAASEGQSEQIHTEADNHFICFTHVDGHLYELDGRKAFPINHGPTSQEKLLSDACQVIKTKFMERDPEEMRFTIVALGGLADED